MTTEFIPKFQLDLDKTSSKAFAQTVEDFRAWRDQLTANGALPSLKLVNGWTTVTPEVAEWMLLRNAANRTVSLAAVQYYARMMKANVWKKTGQPIIFDDTGTLIDAQHRLWAGYLSGSTFQSYVIADVPADPMIFAYIDNNKPRTSADALATAGYNGLSKNMALVVQMAVRYEADSYTANEIRNAPPRMWPAEVVHYAKERSNIREAARLMAGEYVAATHVISYNDVAAFAGYKILDLHDEETLSSFMEEVGSKVADDPSILAFQNLMAKELTAKDPMKKHQVLGSLIKVFNAWLSHTPLTPRTVALRVNEAFPRFADPVSPVSNEDADIAVQDTPTAAAAAGQDVHASA
jgi:hypothetical protein